MQNLSDPRPVDRSSGIQWIEETQERICGELEEADGTGRKIQDVCRERQISEQTFPNNTRARQASEHSPQTTVRHFCKPASLALSALRFMRAFVVKCGLA